MELRHLRYFVAVAEERHFGRAAARLHMAQPPLSQQIRQLEDELGLRLLQRTTRRVELTAAGETYLVRAQEILTAVAAATDEAQRVAAGSQGRLVIGCVGSATYSLLPPLVRQLREDLPGVEVAVQGEMLAPAQVAALQAGQIDLGLLRRPVDEAGLLVQTVRSERLIVAVPEGHRLAARKRLRLQDLAAEDFVMHAGSGRSVMHGTVLELCRVAGFEPRIRHEVAETSTLVTFVAAGLGVAVVPASVAELQVPGAAYRPLTGKLTVELAVATRADDDAPPLQRALEVLLRRIRREQGSTAAVRGSRPAGDRR
ncbi:LysR family transcriptional regulator [Kribbella capetownensis]|uniref:LysR family transcriptional regulator n=1 Tax=Kribbella capetownensis TaxID=1572659 RepID=A0A4R0JUI4_9ACTN|nr:LysR substrate-binding domain-containing protein [Kribbella capetownensis]TCC48828.1 LysR family transcriptional regulator [Kribbella capetownensis]